VLCERFRLVDGIMGGHTSFLGVVPALHLAVVVLQNSINHDDMIGETLLDRLAGAARARERAGRANTAAVTPLRSRP
jgi:hypothetical protein